MFTRERYQQGSMTLKMRQKGEPVWEFRYYETDPLGKRRRRAVAVGTAAKYASASAAMKAPAVQAALLKTNSGTVAAPPITFGALLARFEKEEMPQRHSTKASYESYIRQHIRPRWENTPMAEMRPMMIEDWLKHLTLAPKTKSHIRGLLRSIFQAAARWELVIGNPISLVRVKDATKRLSQPIVITAEQFRRIQGLVPEPYKTMVTIAGCLGLRVSEIVGLRWEDFDFDAGRLTVKRGVVHGHVGETKTEYSHDCVPLDDHLVRLLRQAWESKGSLPEGWVFANPRTDRPYHQEQIQKNYLVPAAKAAQVTGRFGWHTFRHSYRSWLAESGATLE